jgi:hypothetical protein
MDARTEVDLAALSEGDARVSSRESAAITAPSIQSSLGRRTDRPRITRHIVMSACRASEATRREENSWKPAGRTHPKAMNSSQLDRQHDQEKWKVLCQTFILYVRRPRRYRI